MEGKQLSIGEAAKATGVSIKTIRYYEEIGLIPKAVRHDGNARTGGNRVYSEADIGRLRFIHHGRMLDLNLNDIRELLAIVDEQGCPGAQPDYQRILARHLEEIDTRVTHLLGLRKKIDDLMSRNPARDAEACSWSTCNCMEPDNSSTSPAEAGRPTSKDGGSHV